MLALRNSSSSAKKCISIILTALDAQNVTTQVAKEGENARTCNKAQSRARRKLCKREVEGRRQIEQPYWFLRWSNLFMSMCWRENLLKRHRSSLGPHGREGVL